MDNRYFDEMRENVQGTPGYQIRQSTVNCEKGLLSIPSTWIVETVRTEETSGIFLQRIDAEGGQRLVIPHRVTESIYRHYEAILKVRRKQRAKNAAETRKQKGIVPFQKKEP